MLLARQDQFGGRQRIGKLASLFRDLPRIDADIADREQDREPHADHIDFRKLQRVLRIPRQIVMQEHQHGGAEHGERADQQSHARRQRRCRDQHRPQQQESERIFQAAGEIKQCREFGDVEGQEPCRPVGLEPLRLVKADAQRHVEQHRERDDGEAGPDRNLEFEAEMHDQDRGELAENREPSQPDQGIQPHVARTLVSFVADRTCRLM